MTPGRPTGHLTAISRAYPQAWRTADALRADRGRGGLPDWPGWCFLPLGGWHAIVGQHAGLDRDLPQPLIFDMQRLAALGAWRVSQGIYRYHPDVLASLMATPLDGDIPADVLLRLPEWCVYVETPGAPGMAGFFAHLEWDANSGRPELRLLTDADAGLTGVPVHLGQWSVKEAVSRLSHTAAVQARRLGVQMPVATTEALDETSALVTRCLSLLLYLCSEAPQVVDTTTGRPGMPGPPSPTRTKGGWRLFPPDRPRVWEVGYAIGQRIRAARDDAAHAPHTGPRPHIRRAHWHGFWSGPLKPREGDERQRRYDVRWLPPIPVAMRTDDDNTETEAQ